MKRLFTWILLFCWAAPAFAQWEDTRGPENYSISTMVNIKDSIFCINDGKIFASKEDTIVWNSFAEGLPASETFIYLKTSSSMLFTLSSSDVLYMRRVGSNSWKQFIKGLPSNAFLSSIRNFGDIVFANYYISSKNSFTLFRLDLEKEVWVEIPSLQSTYNISIDLDPQKGFIAVYNLEEKTGYQTYIATADLEGKTWTVIDTTSDKEYLDFSSMVYHDSLLFATNYTRDIYQSNDFGKTWTKLELDIEFAGLNRLYSINKSLFVVAPGRIYLSKDRGQNFEAIVEDFFIPNRNVPVQLTEDAVFYSAAGFPGFALLDDGFWFQANLFFPAHFRSNAFLVTEKKVFCYGLGGCIDLSTLEENDTSSLFSNANLPKKALFTSYAVGSGKDLFALGEQGIYHYDLDKKEWELAMDSLDLPFLAVNPTFASKGDSMLMASNLGGYLWNKSTKRWEMLDNMPFIFDKISLRSNDKYFYGLIDNKISFWRGGSTEWQSKSFPFDAIRPIDLIFKGDTLFLADRLGFLFSTNLGNTWTRIQGNSPQFRVKFVNIGNRLFSIDQDQFTISEVNAKGITLHTFNINNAIGGKETVNLLFNVKNVLFARTRNAANITSLYLSDDLGKNWKKLSWNAGFSSINDGILAGNDQIYFSTDRGVWTLPFSDLGLLTSVFNPHEVKEAKFFPNPSTGKFALQTKLTELNDGPVQVNVFNTFGQKIRSYTSQLNGSTLEIDLSDANNGVYFIFIQAGSKAWKSQVVKTN